MHYNMLTGVLTKMGTFVAGLGVDLQLGRMIGLGAQFGCLPEVYASILFTNTCLSCVCKWTLALSAHIIVHVCGNTISLEASVAVHVTC
jgi:Helicase associated domain (HA2)